VQQKVFC